MLMVQIKIAITMAITMAMTVTVAMTTMVHTLAVMMVAMIMVTLFHMHSDAPVYIQSAQSALTEEIGPSLSGVVIIASSPFSRADSAECW